MGVNFPLVLLLATSITGFIWLLDVLLLRRLRIKASRETEFLGGGDEAIKKQLKESKVVEYSVSGIRLPGLMQIFQASQSIVKLVFHEYNHPILDF